MLLCLLLTHLQRNILKIATPDYTTLLQNGNLEAYIAGERHVIFVFFGNLSYEDRVYVPPLFNCLLEYIA